jgi:hypothetical protein
MRLGDGKPVHDDESHFCRKVTFTRMSEAIRLCTEGEGQAVEHQNQNLTLDPRGALPIIQVPSLLVPAGGWGFCRTTGMARRKES